MNERTPMPAELGARLRRARRARGLGLRGLGRRTGASYPYLAAIERGEKAPGARVAEAVIGALGLDPDTAAELRQVAEQVEEGRERRAAERQGGADGAADPCGPPAMLARGRAARGQAVSGR